MQLGLRTKISKKSLHAHDISISGSFLLHKAPASWGLIQVLFILLVWFSYAALPISLPIFCISKLLVRKRFFLLIVCEREALQIGLLTLETWGYLGWINLWLLLVGNLLFLMGIPANMNVVVRPAQGIYKVNLWGVLKYVECDTLNYLFYLVPSLTHVLVLGTTWTQIIAQLSIFLPFYPPLKVDTKYIFFFFFSLSLASLMCYFELV